MTEYSKLMHFSMTRRLALIACFILVPTVSAQTMPNTEPVETPQPLKTIGQQDSDNVWQRVLAAYQMDHTISQKRIDAQYRWFRAHPKYMKRVSARAQRYLYYIIEQIEARQLPGEMALLPIVESAFDPFAYSHGRASGVWQFIPGTGRLYGLKQDWWYDGRRDIRAATQAALTFLDDLQGYFKGDWLHALAAYNSGAGTVQKSIRRNRKSNKPIDFWHLKLPKETRAYVPKLLALARLLKEEINNPDYFPTIKNEPYFAIIETYGQIDLSKVANMANVPIDDIYNLNPGFNRWATHPKGPHTVLVPIEKAPELQQRIAALPASERVKWKRYRVQGGDSLNRIAKKFRTTTDVIRSSNDIRGNTIRKGQHLLIPSAHAKQSAYVSSLSQRIQAKQSRAPSSGSKKSYYTVKSGDSFWRIAKRFGVNTRSLAKWNSMAPKSPLRIGQRLVIWQSSASSSNSANRGMMKRISYRVRNGDSLASIAKKFKVATKNIKRWNRSARGKYIHPGDRLTIHVDITR